MVHFKTYRGLVVVAAVLCFAMTANAQETQSATTPKLMMTRPAKNINEGEIIGGKRVGSDAWPATFLFRNSLNERCTATAVGDRVILTAAHCVGNGHPAIIQLNATSAPVNLVCDHHPMYSADLSADFALCMTERPLALERRYEVISSNSTLVDLGKPVTILGFGCLTTAGVDDNQFLYEGGASITNNNTMGWVITTGAAVCFGDSGGAAYSTQGYRRIIGINSRGNISTSSWLALTSAQRFLSWATTWRKGEGSVICGIHAKAGTLNCHQ